MNIDARHFLHTSETVQDGGWSLDDRIMVVVIGNR